MGDVRTITASRCLLICLPFFVARVKFRDEMKMKEKTSKKKAVKKKKLAVRQGEYKVGNKKPPKEYQFQPGQSGNPNGPPKRRTNLWVWFCKYMQMNDAELKKLKPEELTQAQQSALKLVENMKSGQGSGSERLARHVFDREEGKAVEHIIIGNEDVLSDNECDEIRETLKNNAD